MALITTAQRSEILGLVIGMFNAAPGNNYLNQIASAVEAGATISGVANTLAKLPLFNETFPSSLTAAEFAAKLVANLLGEVTDAGAKTFATTWVTGKLTAGTSRGDVILQAVQALAATTNPLYANAKAALLNKVAVSEYYSVTKQLSDTDLVDLQQVIAGVTSSAATVVTAKANIDLITLPPMILTTGVDNFLGGAGNDSFIGLNDAVTGDTWTGLDVINGGAGADTFTLNDIDGDASLTTGTMISIEKLILNSAKGVTGNSLNIAGLTTLTDATILMNAAPAATTITASTTLASLNITNVAAFGLSVVGGSGVLSVNNNTTTAVDVGTAVTANKFTSASFTGGSTVGIIDRSGAAAAVGSTLTTVSLNGNTGAATLEGKGITAVTVANGVAASDVTITNATAAHTQSLTLNNNATGVVITDATATTVNVATTGTKSAVALAIAAATTLNTSGAIGLTLDTVGADYTALKTVNITNTGSVTADLSGAAALTAVVATTSTGANTISLDATAATYAGGSGVDKVTITATATKTLDGGAGTDDVIVLNAAGIGVNSKATGFEVLGLGALASGAYDATGFTKLTHGLVAGAVTYDAVAPASTLTITAAPGAGATVNLKDATGTADSLAIKITNSAGINANTITAAGVESVTINSDDSATTATGIAHTLTLAATSAATVTVTGDAGLTLINTNVDLTLVDASAITKGVFTFTSAALTKAATINGGAGNDVIDASASTKTVTVNGNAGNDTITTGASADVINGGDGNDTITSGAGLDAVNVGAGTDTFVVSANSSGNIYAALTGMAAGDKIDFMAGGGAATFEDTAITLAPTAAFADFLQAASAGADTVTWFQYAGDTYLVHNAGATDSFENGVDQVVKLVGIVDLAAATIDGAATNVLTLA